MSSSLSLSTCARLEGAADFFSPSAALVGPGVGGAGEVGEGDPYLIHITDTLGQDTETIFWRFFLGGGGTWSGCCYKEVTDIYDS